MAVLGEQINSASTVSKPAFPAQGRGLLAAAFSAIIPGAGQMLLGQWRRGLAWLLATVGLLALVWFATQPTSVFDLARMAVQPRYLIAAFAVNALLGLVRLLGVFDAWRLGSGEQRPHTLLAGTLLAITLFFTAAPHVVAGYYDLVTWQMLDRVFSGDGAEPEPVDPETYQTTREIHLTGKSLPVATPVAEE